ncbi:TIGR03086 family metal-binding protein [Streptantibioticus silvisoli]|uniref:TIGR03086 family metal-binding protein n=1 Tax=Streptantibioticus silvisoli TaxID=2705255 RepID=A0ABT6VUW6_9ACTN|nr:TIGR03086 family metal-binding protein [Streptantibioticus silvisoli]MDI5961248.1 TIGR03086 family metal-binding protein [Streptantibioticus silvisoli]
MTGLVDLDRRAVEAGVQLVAAVTGDLARPTPCAGWTLGRLLAHMAGQHRGFAAAARGGGADLAVWADLPVDGDPAQGYAKAAAEALTAFAEPGAPERRWALPEVHPTFGFPGTTALGFHLLDYVVHGWDVAESLGTAVEFDDEVLGAALAVAERVPDGPERLAPGAAFRPALPAPGAAGPLERILAATGRSPAWRA